MALYHAMRLQEENPKRWKIITPPSKTEYCTDKVAIIISDLP